MNWLKTMGVLGAALAMVGAAACGGADDDDDTTAPAAGDAAAAGSIKVATDAKLGQILTSSSGLALYTFTRDSPGASTCVDACAVTWPPLVAGAAPKVDGASGEFALIARPDGSKQIAFNGRPLYRYAPDSAPGDVKGEGVGGVWFVAKANGAVASDATPGATGSDPYGY